jgi:lipopolysaccharide export system protein LptA
VNRILAALTALVLAVPATAQTNIDLSGIAADPSAPVEVTADNLNVDQDTGSAVFSGNVVIGQGDLRLSAPSVQVSYAAETGGLGSSHSFKECVTAH